MLNEIFLEKLKFIANDDILIDALKDLFFKVLEKYYPVVNELDNNEIIGEKFRAYNLSKDIINECILEIKGLKLINKNNNLRKEI